MKKFLLIEIIFLISFLIACKPREIKDYSVVATGTDDTISTPVPQVPFDPDPTDSVPVDKFIIQNTSKQRPKECFLLSCI